MSTYLGWALRHKPKSLPANVASAIATAGAWRQYPLTSAQGSPRILPGTDRRLLTEPVGPKLIDAMESWVQEEQQRMLPDGPPASIFYDYSTSNAGVAWPLNKEGKPVPVNLFDCEHLTVDQLLTVAHRHPDPAWRLKAAKQAMKLREAVYKVVLDPSKAGKQGQPLSGNQRAAGYTLDFAVKMNRAFPNPSDWAALATMVLGLHGMCVKQGVQPFVPLNPYGLKQADHGFCQWVSWMVEGPYLLGLCEVYGLAKEAGVPDATMPPLLELIYGALDYAGLAFEKGNGSLPADDLDPSGKVHILDKPAMSGWCLWGLREADYYGFLPPDLKAKCVALRDAVGYMDDRKITDKSDDHVIGLCLLAGEWLGWKGATA